MSPPNNHPGKKFSAVMEYFLVMFCLKSRQRRGRGGGGGGIPGNFCGECAAQILTLFQTKKCHFSHEFSDLS